MVVAIDGPAGVGKSSVASYVARQFGLFNLNSGSFYRAVAVKVMDEGADLEDVDAVVQCAENAALDIRDGVLFLDGKAVEHRLRTDAVDHWSSVVSTIIPVRRAVNRHLRRIAGRIDLVAEGRDMTTVVFPSAEVKIFLDADPAVRARRRHAQGTSTLSLEELETSIRERDERDRRKEEGALTVAPDAVVIDTSALTLEQVCEKVSGLIKTYL